MHVHTHVCVCEYIYKTLKKMSRAGIRTILAL